MVIAMTPGRIREYVCQEDRDLPEKERTVFQLRTLSEDQGQELKNSLVAKSASSGEVEVRSGTFEMKALRMGLAGCRNFRDEEGQEVEFRERKTGPHAKHVQAHPDFIARIPPRIRTELADAIYENTFLEEDEEKN